MKLKNAKISILIGDETTSIEFIDSNGAGVFASAKLTNKQLAMALGRLSHCECEIDVIKLDKVGKTMENKDHEFEIPERRLSKDLLRELCDASIPEGWISDHYYNSQGTFFEKGGKFYARTTIRRWV